MGVALLSFVFGLLMRCYCIFEASPLPPEHRKKHLASNDVAVESAPHPHHVAKARDNNTQTIPNNMVLWQRLATCRRGQQLCCPESCFFSSNVLCSRQVVKGKLVADWQIQRINAATSFYRESAPKVFRLESCHSVTLAKSIAFCHSCAIFRKKGHSSNLISGSQRHWHYGLQEVVLHPNMTHSPHQQRLTQLNNHRHLTKKPETYSSKQSETRPRMDLKMGGSYSSI